MNAIAEPVTEERTMTRKCYQSIIKTEVLVVGGGPTGTAAALAAARNGADVLLVENYGFLGGAATAALVNPFMQYQAGGKPIIAGILAEIVEAMGREGGIIRPEVLGSSLCFDPEIMKMVLLEMLREAGVSLLLHTRAVEVCVNDGVLSAVMIHNKSGCQTVLPQVTVDASGDADIAWMAGAPTRKGRDADGLMQPVTLNFRLGGVNEACLPERAEINRLYDLAKERGEINNPRENVLMFRTTRMGEMHFNTTRVTGIDGTDARDLTRAEIEARRQTKELAAFFKRHVPGFENSFLLATAAQIGIRETRRIVGEYIMNEEDILDGKQFPDVIAQGSYCIDIHNPAGTGTVIKELAPGAHYDIPYRCLVPLEVDNLLVGGRPISTTHEAHSSTRIMPICMATGQAAGTAAAQAAAAGRTPREINISALQERLRQQGALLD